MTHGITIRRVMQKCGMKYEGTMRQGGKQSGHMRRR